MSTDDDRTLSAHAAAVDDTLPVAAAQRALEVGMRLAGRYQIVELLGRGGMGAVYLAIDDALDGKRVALKVVPPELAGQGIEALRREVLLAQDVTHPNVCRIYDLELADGRWMIKMEYIAGETLGKRLAGGPLPIEQVLTIARGIADGLAAVHAKSVIHRDLKPSNIMLGSDGRVVVMDFGIARVSTPEHASDVAGTPMYMAPEQVRGERVDARADLYALGCVLYHLLVGEVPFPAKTPSDAAQAQLVQQPSDPRRRRPETPKWLARTTLALLAKDPAVRPADAATVRRMLAGPRRGRWIALAAAVAAVAVLVAMWPRGAAAPWHPALRFLPAFDENAYAPALSPDGTQIAYSTDRDQKGHYRLHVCALDGSNDRVVSPLERSPLVVRWADAGRSLLFMDEEDWSLYRMPAEGGATERLAEHAWGTGCGDAILIVEPAPGCDTCYRMMLRQGDDDREVARFPPDSAPFDPACDREGRRVVYAYDEGQHDIYQPADVWLLDLASGERRALTDQPSHNPHPTFTPDGQSVVATSQRSGRENLWELPLDGGPAVQLTADEGNDIGADVSSDGRTVAYNLDITSRTLFAHPSSGGLPHRVVSSRPLLRSLSIARGVAIAVDDAPVPPQIVRVDLATGDLEPLAAGQMAAVSPDGREVVYATDADRTRLFTMSVDGGEARPLVTLPAPARALVIGPDGVAHTTIKGADDPAAWRITREGVLEPDAPAPWVLRVPSPDGGTVLWVRKEGDRWIGVFAAAGGEPAANDPGVEMHDKLSIGWDARGTSIVYIDGERVMRASPSSAPVLLFQDGGLHDVAQSDDGATVYTTELVARVQRALITNFDERR